jgi:hypothetical protein
MANLNLNRVLSNAVTSSIIKTDHVGVNGYGELGEIRFVVPSNYTTPTTVSLQASQLKLIDANGLPISSVSGMDTLYINMSVGLDELNESRWNVYPNPITADRLTIVGPIGFESALLTDMSGRVINSFGTTTDGSIEIPSSLVKGVYLLEINTRKGTVTKKVVR